MQLNEALKAWLRKHYSLDESASDELLKKKLADAVTSGDLTQEKLTELLKTKSPSAADVFGGARVVSASESYATTKRVGKHVKTGLPVRNEFGREVETPSQLEMAKAGAWLKYRAARDGCSFVQLTDHERQLVGDIFEHDKFAGPINGDYQTGIAGAKVKALISDSSSGGQELNPIWFDEMIVTFPLLNGELLPQVTLVPVPRGASIEGASIGNPSVVWGTAEGTAVSVFDTTSLAAAIDTSIHPVTACVEFGRDLAADSPANVGQILMENIGQVMMKELDRVIVAGNGTSECEGIFEASSITTVGWGGDAATVSDYEGLMFGVGKQYRLPTYRPAFFGNDVSYSRARGIPVSSADQRRVFGMDHSSYRLLEHPYKISNDLANTKIGYGALSKYRMYRRQATEARFESGGKELALKNLTLLVVRGRWGGRVVDANAFAITETAEA